MPNYVKNIARITGPSESLKKIQQTVKSDESAFDFNKIIPMPDHIYNGPLGFEERKKYGSDNWYDWSIKNWGTKWNACDATSDIFANQVLTFEFDTAWSFPEPIWDKLAEMFPEVNIYVYFADEDLGVNCGTFVRTEDNAESFITDEEGNMEFACWVWGYDPDEIDELTDEVFQLSQDNS